MKKALASRILVGTCMAIALCTASAALAFAEGGTEYGGWIEGEGYYTTQSDQISTLAATATPMHTGQSEETVINGTTHKRAHGWTTWSGVYHYTTAQMEHNGLFCNGTVITTSGRVWGMNGTEAISPWAGFDSDACCGHLGQARTYYGNIQ